MQNFFDCGIDLGTTNSCIAIPDEDYEYTIIDNQADRMSVTPSAVSINGKGRMIIGQRAYNSQNTDDLAIQFKRQMGTNKVIHFKSAGIDKYPEDLSSEILKRLRSDAETRLNKSIKNAVITVPAAFKTLQSEATNKAGKLAGFKNIILLQEPIAAAVAYGVKPESKDKYWMVFDYGGGTLDVAIVSTVNNRLEVLNSEGDNYFGGSDLDRLIFNKIILPKLEKEYVVDDLLDEKTSSGKSIVRRILLDCENCKIELSNKENALFELFDIDDDNGEPIEFECTITRGEFNSLIIDTVNKSIEIAKSALAGANITKDKLDKIILVGGSTFIPLVRQRLADTFGKELESSINPMTVVAAGAAIYASTSVIDVDEEVVPLAYGSAVLTLTYDPISSEQKVEVIGKVNNISEVNVSKIRIDCAKSGDFSGVCWTSGWTEFLDKKNGVFDVDVLLQKNVLNNFKVFLCDEYGKEIEVENALFQIKHTDNALKTSAPPATASIGIKIIDPNNNSYNKLNVVIKKNTPLPAKAEQTYKTTKDINPLGNDSIKIEVFEGENVDNPEANAPAGIIYIQSSQMDRHIPKGTEIELTIEADENRNIIVSGYIPNIDYIIPQETLRPEAKIDLEERLDTVDRKLARTEASISNLKSKGVDTSSMESRLEVIKEGYGDAYDNLDNDESSVDTYIEEFYDLETEVINQERSSDNSVSSENDYSSRIEDNRKDIIEWGDVEAKEQFEELEYEYKNSYSEEEKQYVLDKMDKLKAVTLLNSFEFLRSIFTVVLARPEHEYVNRQKAEYWKTQAYEAINNNNVAQLRNAFIELMNLQPNTANNSFAGLNLADLTL